MTTGFIYEKAVKKLVNGTFDLDSHAWKAALLSDAHTPDEDNDEFYSDVSADEVSGSNYTSGGKTLLNVSLSIASGIMVWDADDPVWNTPDYTFRYVVVYDNTLTNKDLLLLLDYGGVVNPEGNPFYIRFDNPNGLLKLTKI